MKRYDSSSNWCTSKVIIGILENISRTDLDLHTNLDHTLQYTSTNHTSSELIDIGSRLIHIKASNDNHLGRERKVPFGDRDFRDCLKHSIDVIAHLSRNGDDGSIFAPGILHELLNLLVI